MTESMLFAEHSVTCYRTSNYVWSIAFAQSIQEKRYWKLHLQQLMHILVTESALTHRISAGLPPEVEEPASHNQLVLNLKAAVEHVNSFKKIMPFLWVSYL